MKKAIGYIIVCCLGSPVFSQQKPPSQAEMDAMMKKIQKQVDAVVNDPKLKKIMEVKNVPNEKNLPSSENFQIKKFPAKKNNRLTAIPKRDVQRIAKIYLTPFTTASLAAFLKSTHNKVLETLKTSSISDGENIYQQIQTEYQSALVTGNVAVGFWLAARIELALYIMGKACIDEPGNTDNLNNYSAMLSMAGAEHLSIPLAEHLNRQFSQNSTILNNLAQAWYGLGDIEKCKKYLKQVIQLFPYHPQANLTMYVIEKSEGNAAEEYAKNSIAYSYTDDRLRELERAGWQPDNINISLPANPKPDPMGLEKFQHPDFPTSVTESVRLSKEWSAYKQLCRDKIKKLEIKVKEAEAQLEKKNQENITLAKNIINNVGEVPANLLMVPYFHFRGVKAMEKVNERFAAMAFHKQAVMQQHDTIMNGETKKYKDEIKRLEALEYAAAKGPGFSRYCPQKKAAADAYLIAYNPGLQAKWNDWLKLNRDFINDQISCFRYILWEQEFALAQMRLQIDWLKKLSSPPSFQSITDFQCTPVNIVETGGSRNLPDFDEINCHSHFELSIFPANIKVDCNTMTSSIDTKLFKFKLKEDLNKTNFSDQFISCTLEVGFEVGDAMKSGPLKLEGKAGASFVADFDRKGLKDLQLTASARTGIGTTTVKEGSDMSGIKAKIFETGFKDPVLSAGLKGRISLISGKTSVESTGVLKAIK